ncbi:hypothetical protein G7K_5036-t1 [Saitoella complicata NRRL Y-17804]|uniref:RNA helicase n=1 Tax=Saitoella complicata (strain BCRC 22490 / CBS 7301 / JCM 7358 / NBRC 10748 / NRRL Y-17804) TaxID=698492 RepID=A0A0E9NM22_SAICN|nr:hypothetical protein G7K_5036-t1 [Saitoella complicata NRRL Y-17804]
MRSFLQSTRHAIKRASHVPAPLTAGGVLIIQTAAFTSTPRPAWRKPKGLAANNKKPPPPKPKVTKATKVPLPDIVYSARYLEENYGALHNDLRWMANTKENAFQAVTLCKKTAPEFVSSIVPGKSRATIELSGPAGSEWQHMATLDEVLPCSKDEPRIRGLGHGQSKREAAANAYLHFIYQMQELDILKDYLQGGVNVVDPKNRDQNNDALLDVANFFARFDRVPKLETVKVDTREGKPWSCTLELPEQNIWVRAVAEKASKAQNDACIKFKRAAELWHARNDGDETFVVKDMSHPSADTAGDFLRFAYRQSGGAPSFDLQPSKVGVTATVKDSSGEVLGSAFHNKKQIATDLAQLYAAVYLKQKHPQYWSEFIVKLAEGNGEVLLPITPADMSITDEAWHAMQRTLQHARSLEARVQSLLDSSSQDPDIGLDGTRRRRTKLLPREQYASKSKFLLNRLQEFEKDPKYEELRRKKAELPMCQNKEDVTKIVRENSASVVIGATGSGKTTQLPQLVLDEYILKGRGAECNIICTQPRRIAATSVAERVAVERGETLGQSVGYRVRFKNVPATHGGSITYCTTGTLLTQLQFSADETLQGISHIMIDEVHERDIQIDFLLVVLKRITRARKAAGKDPIKIVLMSATIDPKLFCKYFGEDFESGECPSISIPGRTFPVTHHYLEELVPVLRKNYSQQAAPFLYDKKLDDWVQGELSNAQALNANASAVDNGQDSFLPVAKDTLTTSVDWNRRISTNVYGETVIERTGLDAYVPTGLIAGMVGHLCNTTPTGSILCFLPGLAEIVQVQKFLTDNPRVMRIDFKDESKYRVYLLHSEIPDAQEKVFEEVPPDVRKIILSTNVAETSITIPDVVYVLDSGKQREKQFDQMSRLTSLACNWVSKSNARQRAGRAGRVQNGHYYTLMSSGRYENMPTHPTPELLRVDLQELALDIKSLGLGDVKSVLDECIESPPSYAVKAALERLTFLQALDEDENMTPLGVMLSKLPVTPQIGKMVLLGTIFRCLDPMIVLAASEGNRNIFFKPVGTTSLQARAGKENICPGLASDHLVLVEAFRRVRQIILENGPAAARGWATANNIRFGTVMTVLRAADQINDVLVSAGLVPRQTWVEKKKSIVFGPEELNKNSRNNSLIRALIYAGLYPNVAMAVTDKLLRTQHENKAIIAMSSTNSFYKRENLTPGSVYCFSGKNRPEGGDKKQGPVLSDTTRISPLAAILFGGNISVSRAVIKIDDWLPFYLGSREARHLLADFSSGLDAFLMRTFDRIKPNGNVLGESDSPSRKQFEPTDVTGMLNADPSRDVWVDGLVNALEKADWSYDDLSYAGRSSRWGL